ncbi:MAG TPA: hypothetical protein VG796_23395 [Verrucomicrobiales bacterium]|nr:hypothetical protein [Verrucomicrobiales bacterium]
MSRQVPKFIVTFTARIFLAACLLPIVRAEVPRSMLLRLTDPPVADSHFEAACSELEKAGQLQEAVEAFSPANDAGTLAALGGKVPNAPLRVTQGLLLERLGKSDEARKSYTEAADSVAGAWHLFRLGNEEPLSVLLAMPDASHGAPALFRRIVADPSPERRQAARAWFSERLAAGSSCAVRAVILSALAEFAFQEGKLDAFVNDVETRASATPQAQRASHFFAVGLMHRYLYNDAAGKEWFKRAAEQEASATPDYWEALSATFSPAYPESRRATDALLQQFLSVPGVRAPVRWLALTDLASFRPHFLQAWLPEHPDDTALVADWVAATGRSLSGPAPLFGSDFSGIVETASRKFPENAGLKLWHGSIALQAKRQDDALRDFAEAFTIAGNQWKAIATAAGKPLGLAAAAGGTGLQESSTHRRFPLQGLDLPVHIRIVAWNCMKETGGAKSLLERADAAGPGFFLSWDEEIFLLLRWGCGIRAWEKLEQRIKAGSLDLPAPLAQSVDFAFGQTLDNKSVPEPWKERLLDMGEALALKGPGLSASQKTWLASRVSLHGGAPRAARMLESVLAGGVAPGNEPERTQLVAMLTLQAKRDAKDIEAAQQRLNAVMEEHRKRMAAVETWWVRAPLQPAGCGAWFMARPEPLRATQLSGLEPADWRLPWTGRYAGMGLGYDTNPAEPAGLSKGESLRWKLSVLQRSYGSLDNTTAQDLLARVDALLAESPNDDLRLLKAQLIAFPLSSRSKVDSSSIEAALSLLDSISAEGGAWALAKASLRARLYLVLNRDVDARKAQEVFAARGYGSGVAGTASPQALHVFPESDKALPPPQQFRLDLPALPEGATPEARTAHQDMVDAVRMDRLMQAGPAEKEEAVRLARAILRRPFNDSQPQVKSAVAGMLQKEKLWEAELAGMEADMARDPKNVPIPHNLYTMYRYGVPGDKESKSGAAARSIRYARHLVRNGTAPPDVISGLMHQLHLQPSGLKEVGNLQYLLMKMSPLQAIAGVSEKSIIPALKEAGKLSAFTDLCISYCREMEARSNPPSLSPDYSQALMEYVSALHKAGADSDAKRLFPALLKVLPLSSHTGAALFVAIKDLSSELSMLPETAQILLEKLAPAELVLPADAVDFPRRRKFLEGCPGLFQYFILSGVDGKKVIAEVEIIKFLHEQNLSTPLVERARAEIEGAGRAQAPASIIRQLLLIAECVREPSSTPAKLEAFTTGGGTISFDLMTALPGADPLAYFRFLTKFHLQAVTSRSGPNAQHAYPWDVLKHAFPLALENKDTPLVQDILRLRMAGHQDQWEAAAKRPSDGQSRFYPDEFIVTFNHMLDHGMAEEAAAALRKNMPLLDAFAAGRDAEGLARTAAELWRKAQSPALPDLQNFLFTTGRRWLASMPPPEKSVGRDAYTRAQWVRICLAAKRWDEAAADIALLRKVPEAQTSSFNPPLADMEAQLAVGQRKVSDGEFLTWLAPGENDSLLLCWHRCGLRPGNPNTGDRSLRPPAPLLTWPADRAALPPAGELLSFTSGDGVSWNEGPSTKAVPLAGSLTLPRADFVRTQRRHDGKSEFNAVMRNGRALLRAAPPSASILVPDPNRKESWISTPKEVIWKALPPEDRPGAFGYSATVEARTGDSLSIASPEVPFEPLRRYQFTGWVRVAGTQGHLQAVLEGEPAPDPVPIRLMVYTVNASDGAWYFVDSGARDITPPDGYRYAPKLRVRLEFMPSLGPVGTPAKVTVSTCDWHLVELPQTAPPPWPVRTIGGTSMGITAIALSSDGSQVAAGSIHGQVVRCQSDGSNNRTCATLPAAIRWMEFISPSDILCVTEQGDLMRIPGEGEPKTLHRFQREERVLACAPDGSAIAVAGHFSWSLWKLKDGKVTAGPSLNLRDWSGDYNPGVSFSDDGSRLVFSRRAQTYDASGAAVESLLFRVFSTADGKPVPDLAKDGKSVPDFTLQRPNRPRGSPAWGEFTSGENSKVRVFMGDGVTVERTDGPANERRLTWKPHSLFSGSVAAFDHRTGTLFSGDSHGCILRWDLNQPGK